MKFEEIKVGETYEWDKWKIKVIEKNEEYGKLLLLHPSGKSYSVDECDVKDFKPIKKDQLKLDKAMQVVFDLANELGFEASIHIDKK